MHARVISETDARKGLFGHWCAQPERPFWRMHATDFWATGARKVWGKSRMRATWIPDARHPSSLAFITCNSKLLPLLEGLCDSNQCRFEFLVFWVFAGRSIDYQKYHLLQLLYVQPERCCTHILCLSLNAEVHKLVEWIQQIFALLAQCWCNPAGMNIIKHVCGLLPVSHHPHGHSTITTPSWQTSCHYARHPPPA